MLSLWANWLVTKFGLNSLKRYLWPVLYKYNEILFSQGYKNNEIQRKLKIRDYCWYIPTGRWVFKNAQDSK